MPARSNKPDDAEFAKQRPGAEIDHDRALKGDEDAQRKDPHGHSVADTADQDEPKAWPSSDRHKAETATSGANKSGK
jgi:hypothetical protein